MDIPRNEFLEVFNFSDPCTFCLFNFSELATIYKWKMPSNGMSGYIVLMVRRRIRIRFAH